MKKPYGKVVLITGASSGIGKACALLLKDKGFRVYGGSRKVEKEELHRGMQGGFLRLFPLDVRDEQSVSCLVHILLERERRIDILINCAGYALSGAVEDVSVEEGMRQFDANFFGVLRMCRMVLPVMRSQGRGLIVNMSAVAGMAAVPFQSMYSASKYALEAMTECLRLEAAPFGIQVTLVEPGDLHTGFTAAREYARQSDQNSAYREQFDRAVYAMALSEMNGGNPEKVAKAVYKIIQKGNPPVRKIVGLDNRLFIMLKRLLPDRMFEAITKKLFEGIDLPDYNDLPDPGEAQWEGRKIRATGIRHPRA